MTASWHRGGPGRVPDPGRTWEASGVSEAGAPPRRQTAAAVVAVSVLTLLAVAAVASLLMADSDSRDEREIFVYFDDGGWKLVDSEVFDEA
jgi:hypothetical protein